MIITIDSNFYASPSTRLLGNYGETMSRSIAVCYPLVEGASLYKLRFLLSDSVSCYEADVTLGSMTVAGSLLSQVGKVSCQWIATGIDEQGNYSVVAKSNIFSLLVGESINGDSAEPVPTYEQAAELFDSTVELQQKLEGTAGQIDEFLLEFEEVKEASQEAVSKTEKLENSVSLTSAPPIIASAQGEVVAVTDSADRSLQGLSVFGKSYQNGIPTPDVPVEIVSTGDSGSVTATVSDGGENSQTIIIPTSIGLRGIPVDSDGNYTDENGQQWICDEIDFARGVKIQRVAVWQYDSSLKVEIVNANTANENQQYNVTVPALGRKAAKLSMCNALEYNVSVTSGNSVGYHIQDTLVIVGLPKALLESYGLVQDTTSTYVTAFKAWAAGNPITILYALATPIEAPLTDEQKVDYSALKSYYPTTTATTDNGAGLKLSYIADTKTYVDNQFKVLFALISSN